MNVPKKATTPREGLHKAVCPLPEQCHHQGAVAPGARCFALDAVLDLNDEWVLHHAARDLETEWNEMPTRARDTLGPGVLHAVRKVDPYEEVDEDGVADMLSPNSGAKNPKCTACTQGKKHYHRKSDGSPVTVPVVLRTT